MTPAQVRLIYTTLSQFIIAEAYGRSAAAE
jgi:hypothetical protein